ncbi:hypothetical protein [Thalassospira marina]|uniref:Uncharacterized protein n=1 Tax=Thalassospira marina TaxID=2048283 RepID=A0A2N3KYH3_9PROT|nr:hypothetical protein [Thalassospira marina]AUG55069.1 hypothetical protein CSC3H3_11205 [Thalassospira marina]PKR55611.1 hypothetical protein COO20_03370 [Thalassospira marina]
MTEDPGRTKSRFRMALEHVIREINHEVISPAIPDLTVDEILPLMVSVARSRAEYLRYAFKLAGDGKSNHPTEAEVQKLRQLREAYEEMKAASRELEHCVDRGYIDLADNPTAKKPAL